METTKYATMTGSAAESHFDDHYMFSKKHDQHEMVRWPSGLRRRKLHLL